jgi:GntR family transcriptional regulator
MRRRGLVPSTRALGIELEQPPADIAESLLLGADDRAWRVERVRLADGQPIAHEHGWYPEPLLPGLIHHDLGGSLYEVFRDHYGLGIDAAEQTLWGEAADPAYAELLAAPLHTPLLVFRRVSSSAGKPLEHVVSRYRGDRYQLHMSLDTSLNTALGRDNHGASLSEGSKQ